MLKIASLLALTIFVSSGKSIAQTIYVYGSQFGSIDLPTRTYTDIGNIAVSLDGLTSHNSQLYAITQRALYQIDTLGNLTSIGNTGMQQGINGLASDGTTLYAYDYTGTNCALRSIDTITGVSTIIGPTGTNSTQVRGGRLAFLDGTFYGALSATPANGLYSFNRLTGAASLIGSGGATNIYKDMSAIFASGGTLYGLVLSSLYSINTLDGSLTPLGNITGRGVPGAFYGAAEFLAGSGGSAAPEPSSLLLLALGSVCFVSFRRRKTA